MIPNLLPSYTFPGGEGPSPQNVENSQSNIITGNNVNNNYHITIYNRPKSSNSLKNLSEPELTKKESFSPTPTPNDSTKKVTENVPHSMKKKKFLQEFSFGNFNYKLNGLGGDGKDGVSGAAEDDNFTFQQRPSLHMIETNPMPIHMLNDKLESLNNQNKIIKQKLEKVEEEELASQYSHLNPDAFQKKNHEVIGVKKAKKSKNSRKLSKQVSIDTKTKGEESDEVDLLHTKSDLFQSIPDNNLEHLARKTDAKSFKKELNSIKNLTQIPNQPISKRFARKKKSISSDFSFSKKGLTKNPNLQFKPKKSNFAKKSKFNISSKETKRRTVAGQSTQAQQRGFLSKYRKKLMKKPTKQRPFLPLTSINSITSNTLPEEPGFDLPTLYSSKTTRTHRHIKEESYFEQPALFNETEHPPHMFKSLKTFYKQRKPISTHEHHRPKSRKLKQKLRRIEQEPSQDESNQTFTFEITHAKKTKILEIRKSDNILEKLRRYAQKEKLRQSAFKQLILMVQNKIGQHSGELI